MRTYYDKRFREHIFLCVSHQNVRIEQIDNILVYVKTIIIHKSGKYYIHYNAFFFPHVILYLEINISNNQILFFIHKRGLINLGSISICRYSLFFFNKYGNSLQAVSIYKYSVNNIQTEALESGQQRHIIYIYCRFFPSFELCILSDL